MSVADYRFRVSLRVCVCMLTGNILSHLTDALHLFAICDAAAAAAGRELFPLIRCSFQTNWTKRRIGGLRAAVYTVSEKTRNGATPTMGFFHTRANNAILIQYADVESAQIHTRAMDI